MSSTSFASGKDIKEGRHILIDGEPCKVVSIDISKTGKHGSAKMRIVAIGLFDGSKRNFLTPASGDVEVPIIEKKAMQVLNVENNIAHLMDSTTYEDIELSIPPDVQGVVSGVEVEVMEAMGKRMITKIKL
ncbi:translation initiation factor IF-5A [Candidatus Micrarchaeota archaeon CG08_land_8_20_14_0_20_49_17]|nr:MAG: translation initiation factor IF-5A [Candidatus Micrarchaeota archaeon CG1_02_49_24]PIU10009.1 MAG: translation initiation factor IF-5A [Candidatus Micrarchaeota archaeon CG08_land_8_20_14_0_20_49_17]PIU81967.1 MAG: translation initiation factor IF-5A [Candidatus Micrarchaeota archaeon CG06_land_8_20_14_3_00_50_6]PIZ99364.1 MAG: translation initiation factor IF-5A [Candidatus Micrarchaeota archaeon CG_4_10_14_0_2_um_filter_49_7]HII53636.1 translation initiation factor IF-5A [Candidatus 